MKNKKKLILFLIIALTVFILGIFLFFALTHEDKNTSLNFLDKQWIDSNKNKRFDFSIVPNIPIYSYDGEGIFLDFVSDLESVTGLEFNKISEVYGKESNSSYGFKIIDEAEDDDILIYEDNYVLLTNSDKRFESISEISNMTVGILGSEATTIDFYLKGASVSYKTFDTVDELFVAILGDAEVGPSVDAIIIPKTIYLDKILKNDKLTVSYNITEMSKKYVLSLGDNSKLNDILTKYFNKWKEDNYSDKYNEHLSSIYFKLSNIGDKQKADFRAKNYVYGYVLNAPFDMSDAGINHSIVNNFASFAGIDVNFQKYSSYSDLVSAFNENNVDFMFNNLTDFEYKMDILKTVSNYDERVVVLGRKNNNIVINSVNSLFKYNVGVVDDSAIKYYFESQNFEVNDYKNIEALANQSKDNDLIVVDYYSYKYYLDKLFDDYDVKYDFYLGNDYNFIVRNINDNALFFNLFDFYLSFLNDKSILNQYYNGIYETPVRKANTNILLVVAVIAIIVLIGLIVLLVVSNIQSSKALSKTDKLKYIDLLTSLKNRNYLNDNIEKWDSSEVYPQAIIVADLNNIKYINDNYGHSEGDNLIKEAANILIKNQINNSEIMRTNGNEFLIYLVGYDEKQISNYVKKLNKEFKELAHGFGIAIGYSIITDAIKTVDDAINEATLEMRSIKEEANN